MSGELGLRNSFRERVYAPLQELRGSDGRGGREIGLVDFINTRAVNADGAAIGLKNAAGAPMTWDDIWCDLGLDPASLSLDNLISLRDDMRYLAPEVIREFILRGMMLDQSYLDLVAGTESVDNMTITSPWIQMVNEAPVDTGEAETIAESDVTWGEKTIKIKKKAKAIHASDELLLSVKLPILSYFLQKFGVALAASLYTEGVTTMINGDQADGSDAIAVVGTVSGTSTVFKDFLRVWIRARRLAQRWDSLINNEDTAFDILQISEFSTPQGAGSTVVNLASRNRIIPSQMPHLISSAMSDNQSLLFDKAQALIFLVFRPLLVESERIIMRQLNGTACSIIAGYGSIDRTARIIVDGDIAFAGNGFPSWMAPLV